MQILQCGYELNFNEYNHGFELEYLTDKGFVIL